MHAQVPQYIDIEDKVIGPLSLKQFFYLLIGAGILFLLYTALKLTVFIMVSIPIALFFLLLAFYKVNNQKFTKFIANFVGFLSKPNIYTWKQMNIRQEEPTKEIIKKSAPIKTPPANKELDEALWRIELK